jgi:dATP pyrophosphohydrolase
LYAVFQRSDSGYWQAIAGGGDGNELPETAARREANEEAGIAIESTLVRLDSFATIPVTKVSGFLWGPEVLVVGEHAFGVRMHQDILALSNEHDAYLWLPFEDAMAKLRWDSNRNALWELDYRVRNGMLHNNELPHSQTD